MGAVAYSTTFGDPGQEQFCRQLRACGIPLITHEHNNVDRFSHEPVDVVPLQRGVVDLVITSVRKLATMHGYRLPLSMEMKLVDRVLDRGATTIHAHGGPAGACMAPVARRIQARLIVSFHGIDSPVSEKDYRNAMKGVFHDAARVLAVSRTVEEELRELGCPEDRLERLPFGVVLRPMPPLRATEGGPLRVVTAARLHPANGVADLVDAVALARRMGAPLKLEIVGDGPDRTRVERHVERSGLAGAVRLRGNLPDAETRQLLDTSKMFVLNRRAAEGDSLPVWLLEAMAAGLCVIATRTGDVSDVLRDGVTGLLLDVPDVSTLAHTLVRAAKDPALRIALCAAGRAGVERDFDLMRGVERLHELYQ